MTSERRPWTWEERLVVFNLYCKLSFGKFHRNNQSVIDIAALIQRTPSAVAMKLVNFASLDSYHQSRGVKGLQNVSKADVEAWQHFTENWGHAGEESERLLEKLQQEQNRHKSIIYTQDYETTRKSVVSVRRGQKFFRETVINDYNYQCCICGISISELLVASHIIAWRDRNDIRLNPHNGLCLCGLHDKAFDTGLIAIDSKYKVKVFSGIRDYLPNVALEKNIKSYDGMEITLPEKFKPKIEFLQYHSDTYFRK